MANGNGFTTKEYLQLIKEDIDLANARIDELHEKINKTPSRQEILGWLVAITSSAAFLNSIM
jgi:hypothetical protein|tara:strand:+ start:214 stop:399 length:186 start_codon:yes stop_codon:yes gene_type:complete